MTPKERGDLHKLVLGIIWEGFCLRSVPLRTFFLDTREGRGRRKENKLGFSWASPVILFFYFLSLHLMGEDGEREDLWCLRRQNTFLSTILGAVA